MPDDDDGARDARGHHDPHREARGAHVAAAEVVAHADGGARGEGRGEAGGGDLRRGGDGGGGGDGEGAELRDEQRGDLPGGARPEVSRSQGVDSLPPLAAGVAEVLAEGIDGWSREGGANLA